MSLCRNTTAQSHTAAHRRSKPVTGCRPWNQGTAKHVAGSGSGTLLLITIPHDLGVEDDLTGGCDDDDRVRLAIATRIDHVKFNDGALFKLSRGPCQGRVSSVGYQLKSGLIFRAIAKSCALGGVIASNAARASSKFWYLIVIAGTQLAGIEAVWRVCLLSSSAPIMASFPFLLAGV